MGRRIADSGMSAPEAAARVDVEAIETLLVDIESTAAPDSWRRVEELIARLTALYGAGLERVIAHAGAAGAAGGALSARLARDALVRGLLDLCGIEPAAGAADPGELVQIRTGPPRQRAAATPAVDIGGGAAAGIATDTARRAAIAAAPERAAGAVCDLCGHPLAADHPHLVDLEDRRICCGCRACALLFDRAGAARYRTVPTRVLVDPDLALTETAWAALGVPVRLAFVFESSAAGRWVAVYPSPAGAVEAELAQAAWAERFASAPLITEAQPDVEAILVHGRRPGEPFECLLAPIDRCYELIATVRTLWKGFSGGDDARRAIEEFFADLRRRSRPLGAAARAGRGT